MDLHNTGNASGVEIVNCIKEAGFTPDVTDLTQLAGAVKLLGGLSREEIQAMIDAAVARVSPYKLCEFYAFRNPALRAGFEAAQGGLLENAAVRYPEAWAYLQTVEGQALCTTEAEWQAMTHATWHTLADGTKIGWNGIGGAPFYAPDKATGALRLPDLRGMYAEMAGFDGLGVGGVHGDRTRPALGEVGPGSVHGFLRTDSVLPDTSGVFTMGTPMANGPTLGAGPFARLGLNTSRVVPTGNSNAPRAYGTLPCVYLGIPAS